MHAKFLENAKFSHIQPFLRVCLEPCNVFLDSDGRGYYDEILPGAYVLRFGAKGIGEARVEVTLDPGENSLQIQLRQSDR